VIISPLKQIQREPMTGDTKFVADGTDAGEDIEGGSGVQRYKARDPIQTLGQQDDLLAESEHGFVAFSGVLIERLRAAGELHDGGYRTEWC
jgi:hypothetical protein